MKFLIYLIFQITSLCAQDNLQPFGKVTYLDAEIVKDKPFSIERPFSTYRTLVKWERLKEVACLIYQVPSSESRGTLFFRPFDSKKCSLGELGDSQILFSEVDLLKIRSIDLDRNPSFEVSLKMKKEEKSFKVLLPFYLDQHARWKGIELYEPILKLPPMKDGEFCQNFDGNCLPKGESLCHTCESKAWSATTNLKCPSQVFGICGEDQCGGKDQFACLRMNALVPVLNCEQADRHFFCQHGGVIECTNEGKVICR